MELILDLSRRQLAKIEGANSESAAIQCCDLRSIIEIIDAALSEETFKSADNFYRNEAEEIERDCNSYIEKL